MKYVFVLSFIIHYTIDFSMRHYAGFSQIGSHILLYRVTKGILYVDTYVHLKVIYLLSNRQFVYVHCLTSL